MYGRFVDDYGSRYEITTSTWRQGTKAEYAIQKWNVAGQYLIAQNNGANASDGGLWTRIDWIRLDGMAPYTWAYCYSAYKAPTPEAAESVSIADRSRPKTGCNGFPFSRMKSRVLDPVHDTLPTGGVPASATVVYAAIAQMPDGMGGVRTAGIDPIVAVTADGRMIEPPIDEDGRCGSQFEIDFYRPGATVHLLAGGSAIGTATLTGEGAGFECVDLSEAVVNNPAIRRAGLAVNTSRFIDAVSHRLVMTASERRHAIALLRTIARDSSARLDPKYDARVVSTDRSGTRFLLLNGEAKRARVKSDTLVFEITIIAAWSGGAWRPELKEVAAWSDPDGKDLSLIHFLDVLRLGNRPVLDVIASVSGYESTGYLIYRRSGAGWAKVYQHDAGGC